MQTDKLIQMLASDSLRDSEPKFKSRLLLAIGIGGGIAFLMMVTQLKISPNLLFEATLLNFWLKVSFAISLLGVGLYEATKSAVPGRMQSNFYWKLALPILLIWVIGFWNLLSPSSSTTLEIIKGSTWQTCSFLIAFLSAPIFILIFWALRSMAPIRPRLTGFMAGLFSGGLAASIYSLHCPELSPVFVGIWYLIGMMIPAITGAILGRKILGW